eukprot:CAMPEP_0117523646 /NCGR_PEP_ID=MMETSP0784-20121206/34835_1 /TAXON_ID=39447 /ORGANISM="" /LENGTH=75 /DNA_ID=CAMNT_0005319765 /DNA_START=367 /DNA_END=595 /DNA_ORIENTATION=-
MPTSFASSSSSSTPKTPSSFWHLGTPSSKLWHVSDDLTQTGSASSAQLAAPEAARPTWPALGPSSEHAADPGAGG